MRNPKGKRFHVVRATGYGAMLYWEFDTYKAAKRKARAMQKQADKRRVDEFWYVYDTKTKEIPNPRHRANRTSSNPKTLQDIINSIKTVIGMAFDDIKRERLEEAEINFERARELFYYSLTFKEQDKLQDIKDDLDRLYKIIRPRFTTFPHLENPRHRCNEPLHNPRHKANPASANPRPRRKTKSRYRVPAGMPDPKKKPSYYEYQSRG